jgi:hypothetical protein
MWFAYVENSMAWYDLDIFEVKKLISLNKKGEKTPALEELRVVENPLVTSDLIQENSVDRFEKKNRKPRPNNRDRNSKNQDNRNPRQNEERSQNENRNSKPQDNRNPNQKKTETALLNKDLQKTEILLNKTCRKPEFESKSKFESATGK